jgi:asparagine synthase (glutamine-hydrolysing)
VIEETRRGYQAADWQLAFDRDRDALAQEAARIAALPEAAALLDVERIETLLAQWPEAGQSAHATVDYRYGLLRAVSAGHFLRRVSGSNL